MSKKNKFLITTLAEYQTQFWLEIGLRLRAAGCEIAFLSFDDRSSEMLANASLKVYEANAVFDQIPEADFDQILKAFNISDLNYWLGHERFAFGLRDSRELKRKLVGSLMAADAACRDFKARGSERIVMIQELGGFLSVIGSFFAAQQNNIEHWFIEPSFFRGRMFFLKNSFAAPQVDYQGDEVPAQEMLEYLDDTIARGAIVVPLKDKHQYTTAWRKVVNCKNARRLFNKVWDKLFCGKKQGFGYIKHHVFSHLCLIINSFRLRRCYTQLGMAGDFVYYPLHVPGDMALTLRSPHLLDQLAIVDFLCRSVPMGYKVAIKEHPAMVGAVDPRRVRGLLSRYDNLVILPPTTNNYEVLSKAKAVVSINSKSGAEAALLGRPVIVLGDAFYNRSPLVHQVGNVSDVPVALRELLNESTRQPDHAAIRKYFAAVWSISYPGELYVNDKINLDTFVKSILAL